jgi:hypothetical protein
MEGFAVNSGIFPLDWAKALPSAQTAMQAPTANPLIRRMPRAQALRTVSTNNAIIFVGLPPPDDRQLPEVSLFALDRETFFAEIDVQAGRLFLGLVKLIAEHRDGHHQGADDEIENVVAGHHDCPSLLIKRIVGKDASISGRFEICI